MKQSNIIIGIIIVVIIGFLFLRANIGKGSFEVLDTDRTIAPEITLQTTEGETISLSQFKGDVVILQAMASWCPSCKLQAHQIKPVYEQNKGKGLTVISLDIQPERSSLSDLKGFKEKYGGDWDFGFYPQLISQYNVRSLDATIIIDKNGKIAARDDGITTTDELEGILIKLMEE